MRAKKELILSIVAFILSILTMLILYYDISRGDRPNFVFLVLVPIQSFIFAMTEELFTFSRLIWLFWNILCYNSIQFVLATLSLRGFRKEKTGNDAEYYIGIALDGFVYVTVGIYVVYALINF